MYIIHYVSEEISNVVIDNFCSQLEKRIKTFNCVKNNLLFNTKLHVIFSQDTDEEEDEVSKSLDNFIDVDNTILRNKNNKKIK